MGSLTICGSAGGCTVGVETGPEDESGGEPIGGIVGGIVPTGGTGMDLGTS